MNTSEIRSLNPDIVNGKISMPYPHVELLEPTDAAATLIKLLPTGDLSIICEVKGKRRRIGSIRKSAIAIQDLMRVSKLAYCRSATERKILTSGEDILEVLM